MTYSIAWGGFALALILLGFLLNSRGARYAGIGLMALAMFGFDHAIETDRGYWWLLGGTACGLGLLVAPSYVLWILGLVLYFAISPERRARLLVLGGGG